jgi:septal ring factor EnvC (AmiA/AmiB activator)
VGSLIEELARREAAARAEADRLRARIERLTEELARAEEQVTRLAITREEVRRVLEESAVPDPAGQDDGPGGEPVHTRRIGAVAVLPR